MSRPLGLFEGFGVELEYMIVRRSDLAVAPVADEVLKAAAGSIVSEVELGALAWCNELVLHVIELKTNGPAPSLEGLAEEFQTGVRRVNEILGPLDCRLLPTAMHPWMDPLRETRLWPHEYSAVYESYNRIFGCQGHGWSNLQSLHMNLPWKDADEFGRLHAAIRLVLPVLPALAASSPIYEGRVTGLADNRLAMYRLNQRRIPLIAGAVVPEPIFSPDEYRERILKRIYRKIAAFDPDRILQHEWLNSRGAIARFDRQTFEIRVLDIQEAPTADLAMYALIVEVLKALTEERWSAYGVQKRWPVEPLVEILEGTIVGGGEAMIRNVSYLETLGISDTPALSGRDLWRRLAGRLAREGRLDDWPILGRWLEMTDLAGRIIGAVGNGRSRRRLESVYRKLADCLEEGKLFDVGSDGDTQL
ncbi:MAG: glutamate-cysteine ligase family protein [Acidobacteriota bacterium]